ncbi:MAG TPA: peptidoglycan editing factor PgeF [Pseudomonadales bacterium]|jgi:YfiH family protein|nr:peptidoglycan editing factor PgeF [Pseudomonadales bacterium]HNV54327.1 peptidoglycan editing factor PgeF [Pseudomonadales bacterium]
MQPEPTLLWADWPELPGVQAGVTLRQPGHSAGSYAGCNLADHVGDDPVRVERNRRQLEQRLGLRAPIDYLTQLHGIEVALLPTALPRPVADAAIRRTPGVAAVLTADCLPILLAAETGDEVAALHAGWRGLAAGVIEATFEKLRAPPRSLQVWLGPAIGPCHFEVGSEVRAAFVARQPADAEAFTLHGDRWRADLYLLARRRLQRLGVTRIFGGGLCTHCDGARFYSYRRDGTTGRMASLIQLHSPA